MDNKKNLDYKCNTNPNLDVIVLHVISKLNFIEDFPIHGEIKEEFDRWYDRINFLGNSWQEVNEKFQNHLIDCVGCREFYISYYKTWSNLFKGYKTSSILFEAKRLLNFKVH